MRQLKGFRNSSGRRELGFLSEQWQQSPLSPCSLLAPWIPPAPALDPCSSQHCPWLPFCCPWEMRVEISVPCIASMPHDRIQSSPAAAGTPNPANPFSSGHLICLNSFGLSFLLPQRWISTIPHRKWDGLYDPTVIQVPESEFCDLWAVLFSMSNHTQKHRYDIKDHKKALKSALAL